MTNPNAAIGPITSIKLNGDNYLLWANDVRTYLIGQDLLRSLFMLIMQNGSKMKHKLEV